MTDPICTCGHGATWHGEFRCFECEHCHLGETDVLRAALEKAHEDTRRLDWIEAQSGYTKRWQCRESTTGRGFRLTNTSNEPNFATAREALDAALRPTTEGT